ncbi:MAG: anaerobic sulfatase maturase [Candidatus Lokiarchaeota archaeon]|nr:anaerobic sulfatase maturase [Candidatus Lokiarchaeota archaeon]
MVQQDFNKNDFQLLIKPTSHDCNLDCEYCFYKRVNKIYPEKHPRMSDEILESIIKKFLAYRFNNSVFCWQGGEPTLMGLDFFKKVTQLQQNYGKGGQNVSNILQTNGILLNDAWGRFLKKFNFFVGLSLDGPEPFHNKYRKTSNEKPTWSKVMKAIKILKKYKIEFNILCVVSKANVNHVGELYDFFKEHELIFLQFIPALECINEKKAPFSPTNNEYGDFLCQLFDLWKENDYKSVYIRLFNQTLSKFLGETRVSCPFDKNCASYFVIEWNGDVYPCDFFVKPNLKLGNIQEVDDFSVLHKRKNKIFSKRKLNLSKICYNCHWNNICYGGCLKDWDFCENKDKKRSYFCNSYRKFFTHSYNWFFELSHQIQKDRGIPFHSVVKKIRRNDDCPCGSGLKYKKCHG